MQDGASAIPKDGYLDTITAHDIKYQLVNCTPGSRCHTTANIPDNQVYPELTSSPTSSSKSGLSPEIIKKVHFMVADPGYDDHDLYESSLKIGFPLVCPVRRYRKK